VKHVRADGPAGLPAKGPWGVRPALRALLDWEVVTPVEELPRDTLRGEVKRRLRSIRERGVRR
jgi:hypothetical protein